jgi:hypothetical protein
MAEIMLKDLETGQDLDHKALAKLIGGFYGGGNRCGKKQFYHYCDHHWHCHHHGRPRRGQYQKFRKQAYSYYEGNYQKW